MGQAFQLMNGPVLNELLEAKNGLLDQLTAKDIPATISALYWNILGRAPTAEESAKFAAHLKTHDQNRAALEDLAWSLLNSKEFLFR